MMDRNKPSEKFLDNCDNSAQERWTKVSLLSFFILSGLGVLLRSKFVFNLPQIDYVRLLDAHSHFAFAGWVSFSLLVLVNQFVWKPVGTTAKWISGLLIGLWVCAIGMGLSFPFELTAQIGKDFSFLFILITFFTSFYGWRLLNKNKQPFAVNLLLKTALACLVLSAAGPIFMGYLFSVKSLNALLYKNALFTYLHLQYNGFFSLTILGLFIQWVYPKIKPSQLPLINAFSVVICLSIIPSMFLPYLSASPNLTFQLIALFGSILLGATFVLFIVVFFRKEGVFSLTSAKFKWFLGISLGSFAIKTLLQTFSIFKVISDPVFGNRAVIMGFLHLVFLAFVSLFILSFWGEKGALPNARPFNGITRLGLRGIAFGIVLNELTLGLQGLGNLLIISNAAFPWLLWGCSILVFLGAGLLSYAILLAPEEKYETPV